MRPNREFLHVAFELGSLPLESRCQSCGLHRVANGSPQDPIGELVLDEVVSGSALHCLDSEALVSLTGEHHDRRTQLHEARDEIHTVRVGQAVVEEHARHALPTRSSQAIGAGRSLFHARRVPESSANRLTIYIIVIDDEHAAGHAQLRSGGSSTTRQ